MSNQHANTPSLTVVFLGRSTPAHRELTFGRFGDVVLDPHNLYLHGEAGRFRYENNGWHLFNTGSILHLRLFHGTGQKVELPPTTSTSVPAGVGVVEITAGPLNYELTYKYQQTIPEPSFAASDTGTRFYGNQLTPAQIDYAVTLAAPRLRGKGEPLPTHAQIARLWGVEPGTVGRTFEEIRARLRRQNVRAIETPEKLVEYLVVNRVVTVSMLNQARLNCPDGPTRRAVIESTNNG